LRAGLAVFSVLSHIGGMTDPNAKPLVMPVRDKDGTGWHVIIRYHEGHERRIEGFSSEEEAVDWIVANAGEIEK